LEKYVPEAAMPLLREWRFPASFRLDLKRGRNSKLGDHRPPIGGEAHRITINHDLPPYSFLITLVHEFAHMLTYEEQKKRVAPHGPEWKATFQRMMDPFLKESIFPEPLLSTLVAHMKAPKASLIADADLLAALREFEDPEGLTLDQLPEGSHFRLDKGWVMEKGKKLRTRFRCKRVGTSRIYLVNGSARVRPVEAKSS
jgi:SprT protein